MSTSAIALVISFGSLLIAATSLGWNIYRDIIRKPRLRVRLMNALIVGRGDTSGHPKRVTVTITNFGPGKTKAMMLHLRKTSLWLRILRRDCYAALMHDYEDPLSGKLPADLEVGEGVTLTFRHSPEIFLKNDDFDQLGVADPFGSIHWCSRANYADTRESYLEKHK